MAIKAKVWAEKEPNPFSSRGYLYCWYYEVIDTDTGNVLSSDNTGNWKLMFDDAFYDLVAIRRCAELGVLKKSRGW